MHKEVEVAKINIETQYDLAEQYEIKSIPTIVILKDKKVIHKKAGLHSQNELTELLNNVKKS